MSSQSDRDAIEGRFGPLGSGVQNLVIGGVSYSLAELLSQVGVEFDDSKPIDAKELSPGRYILRYLDGQDGLVVAAEFDGEFRLLSEARAKIAGGEDDSSDFAYYSGH